ncbi:MAG: 16S rRNA processing protein RimM [Bacteroidales bacterium]|nr:16S rRNA processing protein RimM [Bacteroidales bacterium]
MKVLKSYGTKGGVIISTQYSPDDIEIDEPVFICFDGLPVPFFIEEWSAKGNTKAFVKLEDVDSLEAAEELVGRELFFEDEEYEENSAIEGFTIFSESREMVGKVTSFLDIPSNPCIEVRKSDGTIVVLPCHKDLVVSINPEKKQIVLRIPEGL